MGFLDWLYGQYWRELLLDRGWSNRDAFLFEHYWMLIMEQIAAVIPISILLIAVMGIFFQQTVTSPSEVCFGMLFAIFGLAFFVDSLRVVVMPLSEQLGTELPKNLTLPWVLAVTGFLGVLVTYAEPAITSLRPLARLVDPEVAPYLYCALMEKQEILVLCIGLGVGLAAMLGTLRFVRGWSLKPMIVTVMFPTLACAAYMWWGDEELRPLLGLAWDCGAVTTGPVTVPVLLALGIGVMKTQREKKAEAEQKLRGKELVANAAADALEGFGIVTLASLFPVLAVELLSIALKIIYTHEDIIAMEPADPDPDSLLEKTPYREIYFAVRAILPLNLALVLLVVVVLRKPLPAFTYYLPPEQMSAPSSRDTSAHGRSSRGSTEGKRQSSFRASIEYIKSLAFSTKTTSKGGLNIFSNALNGMSAYALARSEGISASFRHASNARRSVEMFRIGRVGQASMEMERPGQPSPGAARKSDEEALKDIEAAFSGELQHEAGVRSEWNGNGNGNGDAEAGAGVGLSSDRTSAEKKPLEREDSAMSSPRRKAAIVVTPVPKAEVGSTTTSSIIRSSRELTSAGAPRPSKESSVKFHSSAVDNLVNPQRESLDLLNPATLAGQGESTRSMDILHEDSAADLSAKDPAPAPPVAQDAASKYTVLIMGVVQAQLGMIMFNLGLNWGFTSIGDQVGTLLPSAFLGVHDEAAGIDEDPAYSYEVGVTIALGTMFVLGVLATRAEPALNVVGATVEKLTKGGFTKNMLIYSVCFGVGTGMVVGATKILFGAGLIWFIIMKYAVALTLTAFTHEDFINIAWDSAGVTTGPVTVPFVLSVGVGCSKAVKASEGFGILACASVWPIITVLVMDGCRRVVKKYKERQG